jgi:hypothetical protein
LSTKEGANAELLDKIWKRLKAQIWECISFPRRPEPDISGSSTPDLAPPEPLDNPPANSQDTGSTSGPDPLQGLKLQDLKDIVAARETWLRRFAALRLVIDKLKDDTVILKWLKGQLGSNNNPNVRHHAMLKLVHIGKEDPPSFCLRRGALIVRSGQDRLPRRETLVTTGRIILQRDCHQRVYLLRPGSNSSSIGHRCTGRWWTGAKNDEETLKSAALDDNPVIKKDAATALASGWQYNHLNWVNEEIPWEAWEVDLRKWEEELKEAR